jgi:hypothetical protein
MLQAFHAQQGTGKKAQALICPVERQALPGRKARRMRFCARQRLRAGGTKREVPGI